METPGVRLLCHPQRRGVTRGGCGLSLLEHASSARAVVQQKLKLLIVFFAGEVVAVRAQEHGIGCGQQGRVFVPIGFQHRPPEFFTHIAPDLFHSILTQLFLDVVEKNRGHITVQVVNRPAFFPYVVNGFQCVLGVTGPNGGFGAVAGGLHEVVADTFHRLALQRRLHTKISSGKNAETTKFGTSTSSLTFRSTATLQMA